MKYATGGGSRIISRDLHIKDNGIQSLAKKIDKKILCPLLGPVGQSTEMMQSSIEATS